MTKIITGLEPRLMKASQLFSMEEGAFITDGNSYLIEFYSRVDTVTKQKGSVMHRMLSDNEPEVNMKSLNIAVSTKVLGERRESLVEHLVSRHGIPADSFIRSEHGPVEGATDLVFEWYEVTL